MSLERIGPYRIIRHLGEGGMGVVYEALHETISRRVAIKVLSADYARNAEVTARFFNEARAVNLIEHPSLVQISDFGNLPDGTAYIVMELLKGESLARRLASSSKRLSGSQTLQIAWQVADALSAAHDKGIVHRDLKPDNIMLVPDPAVPGGERAKLLDFGIAKLAEVGGHKTRSNIIMGTPRYMSPEQCRGAGEVDAQSDVYSLGVMLYEMLAGRLPFNGEGSGELIAMHMFQEPPPLAQVAPHIAPVLAGFVHRLLQKDRRARPEMAAVVQELARLQSGFASLHEPSPTILTRPSPPPVAPFPLGHASTLGQSAAQQRHRPGSRLARIAGATVAGGTITALLVWGLTGPKTTKISAPTTPELHAVTPERSPSTAHTADPGTAQQIKQPQSDEPSASPRPSPESPRPHPVADISVTHAGTEIPSSPPPGAVQPTATLPRRHNKSPSVSAEPTTPQEPVKSQKVNWALSTTPPGAAVVAPDGKILGYTPWLQSRPSQDGNVMIRLRKDGYAERKLILNQKMDEAHSERLLPAAPSPQAKPARNPSVYYDSD